MSFQGFVTPGIVEELYIADGDVLFRNYSVNNTLSLGLTSPVSVKWGVKDNHFFVQTGTGSTAVFHIYTLDRAAEGAIYVAGIVPVATLVQTVRIAAMDTVICNATFEYEVDLTQSTLTGGTGVCLYAPWIPITDSQQATVTFRLRAATFSGEAFGGASGSVTATMDAENAVLDGDLNLWVPFQLAWASWVAPAPIPSFGFLFNETHSVIVNPGTNAVLTRTLQATVTRRYDESGDTILASLRISGGDSAFGRLENTTTTREWTFYTNLAQLPESAIIQDDADLGTVWQNLGPATCSWTQDTHIDRKRWTVTTRLFPLSGLRSSGPISGNLIAAVLYLKQVPTNDPSVPAWASDVTQEGWFLLRGGGLVFSTTLRAIQASAPGVTLRSANEKYLLWSIPGFVYRTTLATGSTIEVGTDITKFTSRSLTLINPVYLYSLDETNDDEGIEGHFFVDIESTPLPTTDLPSTDSLVKWDMFNPVDDLKHL